MESDPVTPTVAETPSRTGGPSGSSARRGSASAAARAKTGAPAVRPPSPIRTADARVVPTPSAVTKSSAKKATATKTAEVDEELELEEPVETTEVVAEESVAEEAGVEEAVVEETVVADSEVEDSEVEQLEELEAELAETPELVEAEDAVETEEAVEVDAPESDAPPALPAPLRVIPRPARTTPVRRAAPRSPAAGPHSLEVALSVAGLTKTFGSTVAVDDVHLEVRAGSLYGIVGPNGAGKTTTLSMVTGLLRPDRGVVRVYGADVWENPAVANRSLGVLPDRLRLFDRLTGAEFLHHAGALHGLDRATVQHRAADLAAAFGLQSSMNRLVADYSVGLTKKIAIAAAMIHSPRLLVLDEPFESVDPVSSRTVIDILTRFTDAGGTVLLSSHSMDLIERVCDSVAIIAEGRVLTAGPLDDVLQGKSLERRFVELAGGTGGVEGMEWLQSFSD